jgi:hypothetical protein
VQYTSTAPSQPGYFWLKDKEGEEIVEVWTDPGHAVAGTFFIHRCGSGEFSEVHSLQDVKWAGPIPLPG